MSEKDFAKLLQELDLIKQQIESLEQTVADAQVDIQMIEENLGMIKKG